MADLFFYGSLRDADIRAVVLGADPETSDFEPGILTGHAVLAVAGALHPMLVPRDGSRAEGVLARGLSAGQVARLDYFEAAFAFELRDVAVTTASGTFPARVYFPVGDAAGSGAWDFETWRRDNQPAFLDQAREVMALWTGGAA